MPRTTKIRSDLPASTQRLFEFISVKEIQRKDFAEEIGMKPSGLNSIFQRGVEITSIQAKAIENQYGISQKWLLNGEGPKMVNPHEKLNLVDKWLLKNTSPASGPTFLRMVRVPMALAEEHFQLEAQSLRIVLLMRTLRGNEELISGLKYWSENIHDLLQAEYKNLKEDLPIKHVKEQERHRLNLEGADPPEMKQWQTIRYYLMDLTTPDEQMLPSSEAASLGIDIDLSWINDHREKFLKPWKELLHSVGQRLVDLKEEKILNSI